MPRIPSMSLESVLKRTEMSAVKQLPVSAAKPIRKASTAATTKKRWAKG
jgi:hypothetical protein